MNKNLIQFVIASVAFLMISSGVVYLFIATEEVAEANQVYEEQDVGESIEGALIESIFFATVGGAYIPVGLWALSSKHSSRTPWLAIIGPDALMTLYVLSRTVDIPWVGQQDDVGVIDVGSKVLQVGIIAASAYITATIRKTEKDSLLA